MGFAFSCTRKEFRWSQLTLPLLSGSHAFLVSPRIRDRESKALWVSGIYVSSDGAWKNETCKIPKKSLPTTIKVSFEKTWFSNIEDEKIRAVLCFSSNINLRRLEKICKATAVAVGTKPTAERPGNVILVIGVLLPSAAAAFEIITQGDVRDPSRLCIAIPEGASLQLASFDSTCFKIIHESLSAQGSQIVSWQESVNPSASRRRLPPCQRRANIFASHKCYSVVVIFLSDARRYCSTPLLDAIARHIWYLLGIIVDKNVAADDIGEWEELVRRLAVAGFSGRKVTPRRSRSPEQEAANFYMYERGGDTSGMLYEPIFQKISLHFSISRTIPNLVLLRLSPQFLPSSILDFPSLILFLSHSILDWLVQRNEIFRTKFLFSFLFSTRHFKILRNTYTRITATRRRENLFLILFQPVARRAFYAADDCINSWQPFVRIHI